jgi:hypothetical protein
VGAIKQAYHRHVAAAREADCRQAERFWAELSTQIDLLNEELPVFRAALAKYERRGARIQVRRIQGELRERLTTRRELLNMLSALDARFPPGSRNP